MKDELFTTMNELAKKISELEKGEILRIEITKYNKDNTEVSLKTKLSELESIAEETTSKKIEKRIAKILTELGFRCNVRGYYYIKNAIMLVLDDTNLLYNITKGLYLSVAEKHETTPSKVERDMRHSIERVWKEGNIELINKIFGYTISKDKGKPSNSEFISQIVNAMQMNLI